MKTIGKHLPLIGKRLGTKLMGCGKMLGSQLQSHKKIGIVGYWATSISTVRSTLLSKKRDRYGFISGFGH